MVFHRSGDSQCQLFTRKNDHPKSQGIDSGFAGGVMSTETLTRRFAPPSPKRRGATPQTSPSPPGRGWREAPGEGLRALLFFILLCTFSSPSIAQTIYAENQIPAHGVEIEYTVTIRNPVSHLYDLEMSIKGIRDTSVSVSMPSWSPGAYTVRDYAKNVQDFRAANGRGQTLKWEQTD